MTDLHRKSWYNSRRATGLAVCLLSLSFSIFLPGVANTASAQVQNPTGLIVPLYSYLGPTWGQLIKAHQANPTVPMVAVISPNDGPGSYPDPAFLSGVQSLQSAGIIVLGYMETHYTNESLITVESVVAKYWDWYGVNGMFFDQMGDQPGEETYYSTLTAYDKSLGMTMTVGNPGNDVPPSFVGTVDTIVVYESPNAPSLSFLGGWHTSYPKSNFAIIAYNVSPLNQTYVEDASRDLGYIYLTDGIWPDPYTGVLPSYLSTLMSLLASIDAGNGTTTTATS